MSEQRSLAEQMLAACPSFKTVTFGGGTLGEMPRTLGIVTRDPHVIEKLVKFCREEDILIDG